MRLGLGCAQLGNLFQERSDEDATAIVDTAWNSGIRYFDTAPHYGLGLSERRLGAALAARPRADFEVSTKVGRLLRPVDGGGSDLENGFAVPRTHERVFDFSRDGVRRSLYQSLERLGLSFVDLALLHDPEDHADAACATGFAALAELRDEGVVGRIGVGSKSTAVMERIVAECGPDVVMVAGRYTLLEQPAAVSLLPACAAAGAEVYAVGVFNSGLLSRDWPSDDLHYEYGSAPAGLVSRARAIAAVCASHDVTLPAAALKFPLWGDKTVTRVVVGAESAGQIGQNVQLFDASVPDALWDDLRARGLL